MKLVTVPAKPVEPRAPISANEKVIEQFFPKAWDAATKSMKPIDDIHLVMLRDAVKDMRNSAEKLVEFATASRASELTPPLQREQGIRDSALKMIERIGERHSKARDILHTEISRIERETLPPAPENLAERIEANSIRDALRGMTADERKAELGKSDPVLLGAVFSGLPMQSGLSAVDVDMARATYRQRFYADQAKRIDTLKRALDAAERAERALRSFVQGDAGKPGIVDFDAISKAERAEAAMKAASA